MRLFWGHFGVILGSSLCHFEVIFVFLLVSFRGLFQVYLRSFWDHFPGQLEAIFWVTGHSGGISDFFEVIWGSFGGSL